MDEKCGVHSGSPARLPFDERFEAQSDTRKLEQEYILEELDWEGCYRSSADEYQRRDRPGLYLAPRRKLNKFDLYRCTNKRNKQSVPLAEMFERII